MTRLQVLDALLAAGWASWPGNLIPDEVWEAAEAGLPVPQCQEPKRYGEIELDPLEEKRRRMRERQRAYYQRHKDKVKERAKKAWPAKKLRMQQREAEMRSRQKVQGRRADHPARQV